MVDTFLAVAAVVLVVAGGRVRTGRSSATTWMRLPGRRAHGDATDVRADRTAGQALEVAGMVCLVGAVVTATLDHRDDVDVDDLAVALIALVLVSVVVAVGRRRTSALTSGDGDERDRR